MFILNIFLDALGETKDSGGLHELGCRFCSKPLIIPRRIIPNRLYFS